MSHRVTSEVRTRDVVTSGKACVDVLRLLERRQNAHIYVPFLVELMNLPLQVGLRSLFAQEDFVRARKGVCDLFRGLK